MFSPEHLCTSPAQIDEIFSGTLLLEGHGFWAGVVSSGSCTIEAVTALAGPGDFFLGAAPLALSAPILCHTAAVRLCGQAADQLSLPSPRLLHGPSCPRCAETIALLLSGPHTSGRISALAYSLLCDLWEAEETTNKLPPLAADAVERIRQNYATLYGVEELAEAFGVSKCHLIRVFSASFGISPGQYLTSVRLDAAKELLLCREYTLDSIAGLCGFSGANYFCRVFRRMEGLSPMSWLETAGPHRPPSKAPVIF